MITHDLDSATDIINHAQLKLVLNHPNIIRAYYGVMKQQLPTEQAAAQQTDQGLGTAQQAVPWHGSKPHELYAVGGAGAMNPNPVAPFGGASRQAGAGSRPEAAADIVGHTSGSFTVASPTSPSLSQQIRSVLWQGSISTHTQPATGSHIELRQQRPLRSADQARGAVPQQPTGFAVLPYALAEGGSFASEVGAQPATAAAAAAVQQPGLTTGPFNTILMQPTTPSPTQELAAVYARSAVSTPPATTTSMQSSTASHAGSSSTPAGPTGSWGYLVQDLDASSMPAYQRKLRRQLTPLMSAVPSERSLESSSTQLLADQQKPSGQFAVSSPAGSNTSSSCRVGVALPTTLQGVPGIPGVAIPAPAAVIAGSAVALGSSNGSRNLAGVPQHLQQQSDGVVGLGSLSSSRNSLRLDVPVGGVHGDARASPAAVSAGSFGGGAVGQAMSGSSSGRKVSLVPQHLQPQSDGVVGLGSPSSSRSSWRLDVLTGGTPVGTPGGAMASPAAVTAGSFGGAAVGQAVSSSGRIVPFVPQHLSWQQQISQQEAVMGLGGMGSSNSTHSNAIWSGRDFLASTAGMGSSSPGPSDMAYSSSNRNVASQAWPVIASPASSAGGPHARDARRDRSQHDASGTAEWANSSGDGRYNGGGSGGSLAAGRARGGKGPWSGVDPAVMLETWLVLELCDRSVEDSFRHGVRVPCQEAGSARSVACSESACFA